jgi:hypothetical protein
MANGTDDFDENRLPEVKRFFAPIAEDLEDFGTRHNLKLEKYPRFKAVWIFNFDIPKPEVARFRFSLVIQNTC